MRASTTLELIGGGSPAPAYIGEARKLGQCQAHPSPRLPAAAVHIHPSKEHTMSTPSKHRVPVLAAHRYVSSSAPRRTPADIERRLNAYALKTLDCPEEVLDECARDMAATIPAGTSRCTLVPVPDHTGRTAVNRRLAEAIALHCDCDRVEVLDILTRSEPVPSTCVRHRQGRGALPIPEHCIIARPRSIPAGPLYLVDNVTTSGHTLAACTLALEGKGAGLVYADARRRRRT